MCCFLLIYQDNVRSYLNAENKSKARLRMFVLNSSLNVVCSHYQYAYSVLVCTNMRDSPLPVYAQAPGNTAVVGRPPRAFKYFEPIYCIRESNRYPMQLHTPYVNEDFMLGSKSDITEVTTMRTTRKCPRANCCSRMVQGEFSVPGGLDGCYWWAVWHTRGLRYYTDWKHQAVTSKV
jgi:hypothetical protein